MGQEKDWRLTGQELYLLGKTLVRKSYVPPRPDWDHDHCAFCWAKFMQNREEGTYQEGYATDDNQYWICPACFAEFKDKCEWTVKQE